ncbi:SDR family oxidoreductase [Saccharopolyspora halophila]|uniref:SDR family oxidoreductase n=1 Tax=Saccharopolyspora halophila TaxID=405551 RepID=A0ABN3G2G1_9PSEU
MICAGRVAIITGGARGLGRAHALELARQGARVVINDIGVGLDGTGGDGAAAREVAGEIRAGGGEAEVHGADVGDWQQARELVDFAVQRFGRLDVLVNNAGVVRDRMFVNLSEDEWDQVVRVHLKGHAATMRHAAQHWRDRCKAGEDVRASVINTTSGAGLLGSLGQTNYAAAKAGIVGLTLNTAAELGRYGVAVNAIAPAARTRMTETVFADTMARPEDGFDEMAPDNVAPLVAWLAARSTEVSGRVFEVAGGTITVINGNTRGPTRDAGRRWRPEELGPVVKDLLDRSPTPLPVYGT